MNVTRPALRYFGGKWRIAPWIVSFFPAHECYVEAYAGGGSVLLRKKPSKLEVYNDLYEDLLNFFDVLRNRPDALIRAISLTPYARAEYKRAQTPARDRIERARRLYVWSWQGRGRAGIQEIGGWRNARTTKRGMTPVEDWTNLKHLYQVAQRLQNVQFECDDALRVIERYDGRRTLFYLDPPYVPEVRGGRWKRAYVHEYTTQDHERLAQMVHQVRGMVVLSGMDCALYARLYRDWERCERQVALKTGGGIKTITECLWLSPSVRQQRLPLFAATLTGVAEYEH